MIPYGKHSLDSNDIRAVVDVLENQFLTQGSQVPQFERDLCNYTGAKYASAVNSGTSALHVACLALDIGPGDIVWTVPNTFAASANCALYCGAAIDFVDIDPKTRAMSVLLLSEKLRKAKLDSCLPKAVVVVHFAGHMCDMHAFSELAKQYGFALIEDAAHALGATLDGKVKAGNPVLSDICVLSFHPVKSITSAEGGAVMTNSAHLANKISLFSAHGINKEAKNFVSDNPGAAHYEQVALGYNYRLSDLHAALGGSQLSKVDEFIIARKQLAKRYHHALTDLPIIQPVYDANSAWHLYVIELERHNRDLVFEQLRQRNIGVNIHYIPVHLHPYYQSLGFKPGMFAFSEKYYRRAITLPLYPSLGEQQQDQVIQALYEVLQ